MCLGDRASPPPRSTAFLRPCLTDRDARSGRCGVEIVFDREEPSRSCSRDTAGQTEATSPAAETVRLWFLSTWAEQLEVAAKGPLDSEAVSGPTPLSW